MINLIKATLIMSISLLTVALHIYVLTWCLTNDHPLLGGAVISWPFFFLGILGIYINLENEDLNKL